MMTRDQFAAHVMEQAMEKHPDPGIEYEGEHWYELVMDNKKMQRDAYIERAMEHEWPLVKALQQIGIDAREVFDHGTSLLTVKAGSGRIIARSDFALSPYTTKPVEP